MIKFKIVKKSNKSKARIGILTSTHGSIETPTFVPVATQAVIKTLTSEDVFRTGTGITISNTFHLHLKPGEKILAKAGGINNFSKLKNITMTDSGGFQVFSLGFGRDLGENKIAKNNSITTQIKKGAKPKNIKITDEGVFFRSPLNGDKIFLGPRESIAIQEKIGADIMFAFDECTPPSSDYEYTKESLKKTHAWAEICLKVKKTDQALYGIIQGGKFKDLREMSAKFITSLGFDGFGIGGEFGDNKKTMTTMLKLVIKNLPEEKPRHLLGIGHPEDILKIIKAGVDTFDCVVPTQFARHGVAFTSEGRVDMNKTKFLLDQKSLDKKCDCETCKNYSRSYITHLLRAKEITAFRLLTFHNIYFFHKMVKKYREMIILGKI